jgi:hypothetical protein
MWFGYGRGSGSHIRRDEANMNLGGHSMTTLAKKSSGYTTSSGFVKHCLLMMTANTCPPILETEQLNVFGVVMHNDGTALMPGIQYDEQQQCTQEECY